VTEAEKLFAMLWAKIEDPRISLVEAWGKAKEIVERLAELEQNPKQAALEATRERFLRMHEATAEEALQAVGLLESKGRLSPKEAEVLRAFLSGEKPEQDFTLPLRKLGRYLVKERGRGRKSA